MDGQTEKEERKQQQKEQEHKYQQSKTRHGTTREQTASTLNIRLDGLSYCSSVEQNLSVLHSIILCHDSQKQIIFMDYTDISYNYDKGCVYK